MATLKNAYGTIETVMTTGLNSLANNALVLSDETTLAETDYIEGDVEIVVTFGTAPTAGTAISVWFLRKPDGTNYEDGGVGVTPGRVPDCMFPVRAVNTIQRITAKAELPPGNFKVLFKNDGTGQAMAASGNTLKIIPRTFTIT